MGRLVKSDLDCADCLCRVCARSEHNDSYNEKINHTDLMCAPCYFCEIGRELIETEEDCSEFLPDEE